MNKKSFIHLTVEERSCISWNVPWLLRQRGGSKGELDQDDDKMRWFEAQDQIRKDPRYEERSSYYFLSQILIQDGFLFLQGGVQSQNQLLKRRSTQK